MRAPARGEVVDAAEVLPGRSPLQALRDAGLIGRDLGSMPKIVDDDRRASAAHMRRQVQDELLADRPDMPSADLSRAIEQVVSAACDAANARHIPLACVSYRASDHTLTVDPGGRMVEHVPILH